MSTDIRSARLRASVLSILATCSAGCLSVASAEDAKPKSTDASPVLSTASKDTVQYGRDTSNTTLEEVIITAERRSNDIQNVAASVSVRTGEEAAALGRYTTRQILEDVPGLTVVDNSSLNVGSSDVQGLNINIRGVTPATTTGGSTSPSGISPTAGVAVYVDGVYEGVGGGYDLDRVELLRGPQGTLYGRSATAGVLAFHTRDPSLDGLAGNATVEFGNYSLKHYSGAVNVPLGSTLAIRLAGDYRDQGSAYYGMARSGGLGTSTGGRAKVLWKPTDDFSLLVGAAYQKNDAYSGGSSTDYNPITGNYTTRISPIFPARKEQKQYWAEATLDVGPVTLTYMPTFRSWEQNDHLLVSANFLGSGVAQKQNFLTPKDDFTTHELRVSSRDDATVKWQGGVFAYDNKLVNSNHNFLENANGSEQAVLSDTHDKRNTKSLGVFAETTIPLTSALRTTLGVRYDDASVKVTEDFFDLGPVGLCGSPLVPPPLAPACTGVGTSVLPLAPRVFLDNYEVKFHNFNYKARLEYDLSNKSMLYGMVSTGYRPGDATIARPPGRPAFVNVVKAEKLTAFELGSKNRFLEDSLQVNAALFLYQYRGFGTSYRTDTPAPNDYSPFSGSTAISLTVPADNLGAELEVLYRVTPHDRIGFNYNYTESKWVDKDPSFAAAQPETKRAVVPSAVTANYEHVFNLAGGSTLSARIDGRYEAAHLTTNLHADWLRQGYGQYVNIGARTIGNVSAAWATNGGRLSVAAYVRNVTDEKSTNYTVGIDPANLITNYTDPRTYGALLTVRF
jgi:iron complex outermembrane receptor protein